MKRRLLQGLAISAMVALALLVITIFSQPAAKDFIEYWSAGQLLADRGDPYSSSQMLSLQQSQGYQAAVPIMMYNPPWIAGLVAPLGWVGPRLGLALWTALAVGCVALFLVLLEINPRDRILAYCFGPFYFCITLGQSSPLLLLGLSLFLRFHQRRPFLAGCGLALMAVKPHLFLVFWVVLAVDSLYNKRLEVLGGLASALLVASALATSLDPHIWSQYLAMLRAENISGRFIPTISLLLRLALHSPLAQLLPCIFGLAWGLWYWRTRAWNWRIHGLLVIVTVFVSPYVWTSAAWLGWYL